MDRPYVRLPGVLVDEIARGPQSVKQPSVKFLLKNPGPGELDLKYRASSCYCVKVEYAGKPLERGQTISLPGRAKAELRVSASLPSRAGIQEFVTQLEPKAGEPLQLRFSVPIVKAVEFAPSAVITEFGANVSSPKERILSVTRRQRSRAAGQLRIVGQPSGMRVSGIERVGMPIMEDELWVQRWQLRLVITPGEELRGTALPAALRIAFTGSDRKEAPGELPIVVRRRSGIDAPRIVHLGLVPVGTARSRKVLIMSADAKSFRVLRTDASSEQLSVAGATAMAAGDDKSRHWIEVSLRPERVGQVDEQLTLITDHADSPSLSIRVLARAIAAEQGTDRKLAVTKAVR